MRPNFHVEPRMSSRLPINRQASLLTTPKTTDLPDRTSLKNFTSHTISNNSSRFWYYYTYSNSFWNDCSFFFIFYTIK